MIMIIEYDNDIEYDNVNVIRIMKIMIYRIAIIELCYIMNCDMFLYKIVCNNAFTAYLSHTYSLLLHSFMNRSTVMLPNAVELVDTAEASIRENESPSFQLPLTRILIVQKEGGLHYHRTNHSLLMASPCLGLNQNFTHCSNLRFSTYVPIVLLYIWLPIIFKKIVLIN